MMKLLIALFLGVVMGLIVANVTLPISQISSSAGIYAAAGAAIVGAIYAGSTSVRKRKKQ